MFDHIGLNVRDHRTSRAFYEQALAPLGYRVVMSFDEWKASGFGTGEKPEFWVSEREPFGTGTHLAFACDNRELVDAVYQAAIAAGGQTTAGRVSVSTTTRRTTAPSCSIRTGTTWRRSAIARSDQPSPWREALSVGSRGGNYGLAPVTMGYRRVNPYLSGPGPALSCQAELPRGNRAPEPSRAAAAPSPSSSGRSSVRTSATPSPSPRSNAQPPASATSTSARCYASSAQQHHRKHRSRPRRLHRDFRPARRRAGERASPGKTGRASLGNTGKKRPTDSPGPRRIPPKMANLNAPGRIAQRESARFTRGRSLVQSQVRPSSEPRPGVVARGRRRSAGGHRVISPESAGRP